jgi:predicted permease
MLALVFGGDARVPIVASPDARVLVFALAASGVSAIVFGLAPALRASDDLTPSMRSAGRSLAGSARVSRWGRGLVVAEIVLSLVVVATAAALSRSLTNLSEQRFGFEGDRTIVITVDPLHAGYRSDQLPALYRDLDTRLNALPGVRSAAFSTYSPFNGCCWAQHQREDDDVRTLIDRVSPRYFETIGTPLVAGRTFTDRDSATSSHVAVVSEAFVRRYIVGNPIGQRLRLSAGATADREIVGVVADAKYEAARDDLPPMIFLPMLQVGDEGERKRNNDSIFAGTIEIRASGDADAATRAVRGTLTGIDPNLAMLHAGTLASDVDRSIGGDRAIAVLSTASGVLALLLTGIGLYGVTAYGVRRRTSEIGVRMALGASRGHVVRLIARGVLDQGAIALAIGVPATFLALRFLSTTLYGVGPIDARDLAIGIGVIIVCVGAAACVPALRASRLNPVVALRHE